mgnify:CR=1 FL=1
MERSQKLPLKPLRIGLSAEDLCNQTRFRWSSFSLLKFALVTTFTLEQPDEMSHTHERSPRASSRHRSPSAVGHARRRLTPSVVQNADTPGFVTAGDPQQETAAAVIQQTDEQLHKSLPEQVQGLMPAKRIKFTSFVGIQLLRRRCQLPVRNHAEGVNRAEILLHKISMPKDKAASLFSFLVKSRRPLL